MESWFVSPASREYFGVESTTFLSVNKFTKKTYPLLQRLTVKYVFFIGEAIPGSVFVLCCSCEITQNMVFQLLKNSKVEINFG